MEFRGLSNNAALRRLSEEILSALDDLRLKEENRKKLRGWRLWRIFDALQLGNQFSPYAWPSALLTFCVSLSYFVAYCSVSDSRFSSLIGEWLILTLSIVLNVFVTVWISHRRAQEIPRRCEFLAKRLADFAETACWRQDDFPNIFTPLSPCIAIQWTFRDGALVNVPWALLVAGDTIVLKPGQEVPGKCIPCSDEDSEELALGDVFAPPPESDDGGVGNHFNIPRMREPLEPKPYRLLETPVMTSIRFALSNPPTRPLPVFQQERRMIISNLVEKVIIPLLFATSMGVNAYRYLYLPEWSGPWPEMLLVLPTVCVLPLIALTFPCFLAVGNLLGTARILATFNVLVKKRSLLNGSLVKLSANNSFEDLEAAEAIPMVGEGEDQEERSKSRMDPYEPVEAITMRDILLQMKLLLGYGEPEDPHELPGLWLSSSLLHVLGSASSLCCIDKKGILSWPNPAADKVFFFRHARQSATDSEVTRQPGKNMESTPSSANPPEEDKLISTEGGSLVNVDAKTNTRKASLVESLYTRRESNTDPPAIHAPISAEDPLDNRPVVPEVLDLYLDPSKPFHLQFDDPSISRGRHMKSLKPLGLAALLNTCNPHTQNHYAHFCAHITAQAMNNEALVPVTNRSGHELHPGRLPDFARTTFDLIDDLTRGCLCELAHQIGFTEEAINRYELCDQLATFRHVEASLVQRSRLAKSLSTSASTRLKFPFPHMVGVVVKELEAGGCQLLSQGTADIVLDSCSDLWDGHDLVPLNDVLRKKILDFYHRSSLSAYCTAFAYGPILFPLGGDVSSKYLELPPEGHKVNYTQSPTPIPLIIQELFGKSGHMRNVSGSYRSNDSLSINPKEDETPKDQAMNAMNSAWACLTAQSQQVFLGMVTMQYQARPPLVQLVEHLETACIRFVHFSKENELRSRVFSEKMGLESGWNCHVSLLSDKGGKSSDAGSSEDALQGIPDRCRVSQRRRPSYRREKRDSTLEGSKVHSFSAPSAMNNLGPPAEEDEDSCLIFELGKSNAKRVISEAAFRHPEQSMSDVQLTHIIEDEERGLQATAPGGGIGDNNQAISASQESSQFTDSTEQTAPVPFDMSNRAKLPRGIENIRPHLNEVDNVPLLVSLFTDCTPSACEEMIRIMQEYDQVVCVLGSTASAHNTVIFLQADAALGVEPLYPQVCMKVPVVAGNQSQEGAERRPRPGPTDVSHLITSLPCALSFRSCQRLVVFELILEARNFMKNARTALQFWLCSSGAICLLMFLSYCCLLPPVLKTYHALFLGSVITPLFSAGLIANPLDGRVMKDPTGKLKISPDAELILYVIRFYGMKFIPSLILILAFFAFVLYESCPEWHSVGESPSLNLPRQCVYVYSGVTNGTLAWGGWTASSEARDFLSLGQNLAAFLVAVYFGVSSTAFVHRMDHLWERNPTRNRLWFACLILGILIQGLISICDVSLNGGHAIWSRLALPMWLWGTVAVWPIILLAINELVKRREIWVTGRYLKRARLEFGTKLGMNSPF